MSAFTQKEMDSLGTGAVKKSKKDVVTREPKINIQKIKQGLQSFIGLVGLTALAIDGVRMRADDAQYMLIVGIGFALAMLWLAFEGSRK